MTCEYCNKRWMSGNKVSHSNIKTKMKQSANVQSLRAMVNGCVKRVYACTRCIRSGAVTKVA